MTYSFVTILLVCVLAAHNCFGAPPSMEALRTGIKNKDNMVVSETSMTLQFTDFCDNICSCNETSASCEHRNLTFIPRFRRNITSVDFAYNNLHVISKQTFTNLTCLNVTLLSLARNNITRISADAFVVLPKIQTLDLSGNELIGSTRLTDVLQGLSENALHSLNLSSMRLKSIPKRMFSSLRKTGLQHLVLDNNNLKQYNQIDFSSLEHLVTVQVNNNSIKKITWGNASFLEQIMLDNNDINTVPALCDQNLTRFYQRLQLLSLNNNSISELNQDWCLPNLNILALNYNPLRALTSNMFSALPKLGSIYLEDLWGSRMDAESCVFNNSNLKKVSLRGSQLEFKHHVSAGVFHGCNNLKTLDMSYNHLGDLDDVYYHSLFRDVQDIVSLSMASCRLLRLSPVILKDLRNLRDLYLSGNKLYELPDHLFSSLTKLTHFYVNDNMFTSFKESTFNEKARKQIAVVSLAYNPFSCTCEIQWLITWMKREPLKFNEYPNFYQCDSPVEYKDNNISSISFSQQLCLLNMTMYLVILGATLPVVIVCIVSSLVYRWRWHIRHIIYLIKHQGFHRVTEGHFTYDGFVVYSTDETDWVVQNIIPNLEQKAGLALCVHERDFDVGGAIVDNIVENIEASRKVLIIVSLKTLQSKWCQFEIHFAQRRSLKIAPGSLAIVLKEDVDSRHMSHSIRALLDLNTYIMWPADENDNEARSLFWERLEAEIRR